MAKKLFDELKIEKKEKSKEFIGCLMKSGLINDAEEYIKEVYTDQSLKLKLNPFEFFNHKVKTLHEKYVTLLNYDEEDFMKDDEKTAPEVRKLIISRNIIIVYLGIILISYLYFILKKNINDILENIKIRWILKD